MKYARRRLVELPIQIIDGDRGTNYPKRSEFSEEGYCLFLNTSNVTKEGFDFSGSQFISQDKDKILRKGKLQRLDIVLTTRGTLGNVGFFTDRVPYKNIRINSGMVLLRIEDPQEGSPAFLYNTIRDKHFQLQINNARSGSAQPQLPIGTLKTLSINWPPLPIQKIIASVVLAYDSLIENNTRRIAILEEMARLIYREWFVHFRFPGHEKVKFVNSPLGQIPIDWKVKKLGEILQLQYGKALKAEERIGGEVPVYGSSGIVGYHNIPIVNRPGIIVGRKGNVGSVFLSDSPFYAIDTVYFVESDIPLHFLYHDLTSRVFLNSDAAVPGLNRNYAHSLPVVLPSDRVLKEFVIHAGALNQLKVNLSKQNQNLRQTRDLLLPRLISGEIDVSEMDIPITNN